MRMCVCVCVCSPAGTANTVYMSSIQPLACSLQGMWEVEKTQGGFILVSPHAHFLQWVSLPLVFSGTQPHFDTKKGENLLQIMKLHPLRFTFLLPELSLSLF